MATKKAKQETNKFKELFDACPYVTISEFEVDNFLASTGSSRPRFVIETVNKIRKIDSELLTETRSFEQSYLNEEKEKLESILEKENISELTELVKSWQEYEQDYWINLLGKTAAIEILTTGKTSVETMTQMVKLPEDAYIKATQICVRLANAIKQATVDAETAIGIVSDNQQNSEASGPKKLALNKVKQ